MQIYYFTSLQAQPEQRVELPQELCFHLDTVLRHKVGDSVSLCNGNGVLYECEIVELNKRKGECRVVSIQDNFGEPSDVHVAIAPTKNMQRTEWAVEKMVEIGVSSITPIICDHSQRRELKTARLEKIAVSAAQQSLKGYLPTICQPTTFDSFIKERQTMDFTGYIAHCSEGEKSRIESSRTGTKFILIGPEGDFSAREVELALHNGYTAVSLGSSRLRTETAAVVAAYLAQ